MISRRRTSGPTGRPPEPGEVVYALATVAVVTPAGSVILRCGDIWAGDDELVTSRPDLFSFAPVKVRRSHYPAPKPAEAGGAS
jgi:hypothetical protein